MEFRILGPLQVVTGDRTVDVPGPKVRTLLAALVVHAGRVVSRDRLFEILWGPQPPDGAAGTLQSHVSHLREALEPGRAGGDASLVHARDPGYFLSVDPQRDVDAGRFECLADEGRRTVAEGAPADGAAHLDAALALWRGEPLAEFTFAPFAQAEIARLSELRLKAVEDRVEAHLALGLHAELTGELRRLITEEPLRERLWGQLMLALYRSGRQADALRAYAELRSVLGEELGIEPSPALARLEEAVLLQKPELEWTPPPLVEPHGARWDTARRGAGDVPAAASAPGRLADAGLAAFERRAWEEARELLLDADAAGALSTAELEALAEATFWTGRSSECIALCERLHTTYLEAGDQRRAAYAALLVSLQHAVRLRTAPAAGWYAMAFQLLAGEPECVEQGYLAWVTATVLVVLGTADPAPALESSAQVLAAGERYADRDLQAVGRTYRGYVLVHQGDLDEGLALLDEAMAGAAAGMLGALATAAVVCRTLSACIDLQDYGRATQWLAAMDRCAVEHGLAGFPGDCRMHHAQVLLARGAWSDAERHARHACGEMDDFVREHAGLAFFTVGEVLRLRGDLAAAEEAFAQADELGRSPQPGLALLLLARGDASRALASLHQALAVEPWNLLTRARLLSAVVEVCLATGATSDARQASAELASVAARFATPGLQAAADHAAGAVALAGGEPAAAVESFHRSWQGWRRIGLTHDAARSRLRLGAARVAVGDPDGADLDLHAARLTFERLGARPDAEEAARLAEALLADRSGLRS